MPRCRARAWAAECTESVAEAAAPGARRLLSSCLRGGARAVAVEPREDLRYAACRESDGGIGGTVVQIDRVAVVSKRVAAGEGDVPHVALAFVRGFRSEDPRVAAKQALLRGGEIEQCDTQPVQAPCP